MVQRFFDTHLDAIRNACRWVLASLVGIAVLGSVLRILRLARSPARHNGAMKAGLKRVDRYVGRQRAESEHEQAVRALPVLLCRWLLPLVIAVDW